MLFKDLEHRAYCVRGLDRCVREVCGHPDEKLFTRTDLLWLSGRVPRLVIDASNQHRELVAELSRLVDGQTIAQAMQHGAQCLMGTVPVRA